MRPVGAVVRITYDSECSISLDHVLKTPSGRAYRILELRRQMRGKHAGRYHLRCIVIDEIPDDAIVHPICWYSRDKTRQANPQP